MHACWFSVDKEDEQSDREQSDHEQAVSEQSEELGFGHELDQLMNDKEYDLDSKYMLRGIKFTIGIYIKW